MNLREAYEDLNRTQDARDGRVWGFVTGKVTDVEDPAGTPFLGRVKARIGSQGDNESTDWLIPMWPGGVESVPRNGDMVVVGFIDGDPHRGFYAWHPTSNTKNRASEWMVLGLTLVGMYNNLVTQFNQLRTDFNTFVTTHYNTHLHAETGANTGPPDSLGTSTTATAAQKGKKADGSEVTAVTTSEKVLSGRAKVQI